MNHLLKTRESRPGQKPLPAKAGAKVPSPKDTKKPEAEHDTGGRLAFFFLMAFTALLYARPSDYIPELRSLHLPEIAALAAMATYALAYSQGKLPLVFPVQIKILFALTVLFALGVPTAFWRFQALDTLRESWLKTLIIFFLLTQTVISMRRIRGLLWVIILCMFFVSAYSVSRAHLMVDEQGRYIGATMGFLSGNYLGIAVAAMFPFMAAFMARTRSWIAVLLLLSTTAMLLWQVVLTASRGNFLQIGFSAGLSWFFILQRYPRTRLIATILSISMIVFLGFAPSIFWGRMATLWGQEDANWMAVSAAQSESQRKNLLWRAVEYTIEDPLLGIGLGCFPIKSGTVEMRSTEWLGTHNTFMQVAAEAGIPALLLFVYLIFATVRGMSRIMKQTHGKEDFTEINLYAKAAMISMLAIAFSGFFAHLAYEFYIYYLVGAAIAIQTVYSKMCAQPELAGNSAPLPSLSRGTGFRLNSGASTGRVSKPASGRPQLGVQRNIGRAGRTTSK